MSDLCHCVDGFVATVGRSSRQQLQCADILMCDQPSRRAARRWIASAWSNYPGCVVVAARDHHGRWCVVATRDEDVLVVRAMGQSTVDALAAEMLARGRYGQWVTATAGRRGDHRHAGDAEVAS